MSWRGQRADVPVSDLAYYASAPDQYVASKGQAWNPKAARAGSRVHRRSAPRVTLKDTLIYLVLIGVLIWFFLKR